MKCYSPICRDVRFDWIIEVILKIKMAFKKYL